MKYVTFYGGFHNAGSIRVRVNDEQYNDLKNGGALLDNLSNNQINRLDRHFCGVEGCTCGGVFRATMEL